MSHKHDYELFSLRFQCYSLRNKDFAVGDNQTLSSNDKVLYLCCFIRALKHYFKDHTAENRKQKFQLHVVPELQRFEFEQF